MKRVSIVNFTVLSLVLIVCAGASWLMLSDRRSRFDDYVCMSCGARRQDIRQWRWIFEVKSSQLLYDTAVSQILKPLKPSACRHSWKLDHFDVHGGRYAASAHGRPAGITFELLLRNERFISELAMIARTNSPFASDVWKTICNASFSTNPASDRVYDWIIDGESHEPLLSWMAKTGLSP